MTSSPPPLRDQRIVDAEHLKLLSIFHFIVAGFAVIGLGFLFLHWFMVHSIMDNPSLWKNQKGGPPPKQFFAIFKIFYLVVGVALLLNALGNLISGVFLRRRIHRIFSLVVAGFNCLAFPFGTMLGVFSILVLVRDSVREVYAPSMPKIPQGF
jgi:hypothetical protein